jgi:hypothetical protein
MSIVNYINCFGYLIRSLNDWRNVLFASQWSNEAITKDRRIINASSCERELHESRGLKISKYMTIQLKTGVARVTLRKRYTIVISTCRFIISSIISNIINLLQPAARYEPDFSPSIDFGLDSRRLTAHEAFAFDLSRDHESRARRRISPGGRVSLSRFRDKRAQGT